MVSDNYPIYLDDVINQIFIEETEMTSATRVTIPADYPQRIRDARAILGLTQTQLAERIGVSYASVNRWENGQTRPNNLSWRRILAIEGAAAGDPEPEEMDYSSRDATPEYQMDFSADPDVVWCIAEAHRLASGHQVNPAFARETSLIDPLPHQLLAVYQRMLPQTPLRFLLADDAGAGKTIMTGLYVREMLARRLIRRVLIVSPAGLVGNWEREMRTLFRMRFRIISGGGAQLNNPFVGPESDLTIVSVDTLARDVMFSRLRDAATEPYDLVVFDEAHKLSADREPDFTVRKTNRYKLAEAIAGAGADDERWTLPWSAQHLLLLTATPHMGKDPPYYYLWRLLLPEVLSTYEAFTRFPQESRDRHFIRHTKEEMVDFDGSGLYPERQCDTLSYKLSQGPGSEQELYDVTTDYIRHHYNRAQHLNRSAARLVMSVFQRRLASSTYALMRSFENRAARIERLIEQARAGQLSEEQFDLQQIQGNGLGADPFETQTADEQDFSYDEREQLEVFEDRVLGAMIGSDLSELEEELSRVRWLSSKAQSLYAQGNESKFEQLKDVLDRREYQGQKIIIFTEHRDTGLFLNRRLGGLGYTGQVAMIHGGMDHQERERQVEFFRTPASEGGANFLVATDAAGEGINLQFCWLMVNYDIPWNPARLEQRMGRIHRYGQMHDPVMVINLVSGSTREGRVLQTLLEKLEAIRRELNSDKVFDVVGRLFEDKSIKEYLESALYEGDADEVVARLDGNLTEEQVRAIQEKERSLFGTGGDVSQHLGELKRDLDQETYRRLLPGYVRRFVEKATPVLDLSIEGDLEGIFRLVPREARALDPLLPALELYSPSARERLTVYRENHGSDNVWIHPGEALFDRISASVLGRFGRDGLKGAVFVDPYATEPYLFHIAQVSVAQSEGIWSVETGVRNNPKTRLRDSRLVGFSQTRDGSVEECPVEHLLLLRGVKHFAPGAEPLAAVASDLVAGAERFATEVVTANLVQSCQQQIRSTMPERLDFLRRGFDYQMADLTTARRSCNERIRDGDADAIDELARISETQRRLIETRDRSLNRIETEPDDIEPGAVEFLVHALIVPPLSPEDADQHDANVEAIAVAMATAYEEGCKAIVKDVSRPALARRAGLTDYWPGFDLLSYRPQSADGTQQELAIEVKGRRGYGGVELSDNEWARACNMRDGYWLYVVFNCATPSPRLVRICDPFGKLLVKASDATSYAFSVSDLMDAMDE